MESYLPSSAFSLWLCEFWIPLWAGPAPAGGQKAASAQALLEVCWFEDFVGGGICRGKSAQLPRWALTIGLLFEGGNIIFCGRIFGLLWLLHVVLELMSVYCDQSVPNELKCSADFTCSFRVSFFHNRLWPCGLGVSQLSLLMWLKTRFFFSFSFLLGKLELIQLIA